MSMVIADSFMKQLRRLTEREQGMVSSAILRLQADPTGSGFNIHKVDGKGDWWTCYVNKDLRIIFKRNDEQDEADRYQICQDGHFLPERIRDQ